MNCLFNINVCRVCMKNEQSCDLWSDKSLLDKYEFTTRLRIAKEDNLPKSICSRCVAQLKVAYTFVNNAHKSENNLKIFLEKISSEFKEVTRGNSFDKKFLNEENGLEDDILSLMDEESQEDNKDVDVNDTDKRAKRYHSELVNNLNPDSMQNSNEEDLKIKDDNGYNVSKDILLIHASNEIDSDCENNSHLMEIQTNDDNGRDSYSDEDNELENNETYTSSINILDSNEECEIRCQSTELTIGESDPNHEYDTIINNQGDTIQCQSIYIDENSVNGTNQKYYDNYELNNLKEDEKHKTPLKNDEITEHRETVTKTVYKRESTVYRFYCDKCDRDFSTKTNLNRHMQSHEGNRPFTCAECKKSFTQKSTLKQHMYTHTGEKPYVCEVCNRGFTQCKSLIFHMRRHTGEKPFHCEYCLTTFRQKDALRIHILKHHVVIERAVDGTETFSCIICQKKFDTKFEFKTHMKVHTTTGEMDNVVDLFRNEEEKYIMNMTTKSKDVVTSIDSESFKAAVVNVSASSAAEPSRAKKFQCRICFKCFALKKSLVRHMRIHYAKGDDLTECFDCDLQFSSAEAYRQHLSICHQYTCTACPELVFKTIQELKMHMFDHELDQQE